VSISGRNSGVSGGARSTSLKFKEPTQNDARNGFEVAKDAGEQQAGSTAASSLSPAATRSGRLTHMSFVKTKKSITQV
jgi:hypothetical protein